jgi:hypothetical protein
MKSPNVSCLACGKEVYMPKNRLKLFKYCCRICKDQSNKILIKVDCAICGNEFEHISSRCNKAKYCSRKCYHKSQKLKGKKEYTCFHCEKKFIGHAAHKRKYCSIECTGKSVRENWHPIFSTVRKKMLKEGLIEACERCGYNEVKQILGIHHIDQNRKNNKKENLMVVCPMCHSLIHRKHICH